MNRAQKNYLREVQGNVYFFGFCWLKFFGRNSSCRDGYELFFLGVNRGQKKTPGERLRLDWFLNNNWVNEKSAKNAKVTLLAD